MKTRSNMPLYVVECTDITKLTDDQINLLRCGDYLVKKTGKQRHAYKVTYKEDGQGICLSYFNAGYSETVSYDFTAGHWVYNSTDVSNTEDVVEDMVEGGTLENAKPIYFHPLTMYTGGFVIGDSTYNMFASATILNNNNTSLAGNLNSLYNYIIGKFSRLNVSMILVDITNTISVHVVQLYFEENHIYVIGYDSTGNRIDESQHAIDLYAVREDINILDSANKIN